MKKLFITAVAVLAFSSAGFAEKNNLKFGTWCSAGAAAAFNVVAATGQIRLAWQAYHASYDACIGKTMGYLAP